jgi:hypothetical protein
MMQNMISGGNVESLLMCVSSLERLGMECKLLT